MNEAQRKLLDLAGIGVEFDEVGAGLMRLGTNFSYRVRRFSLLQQFVAQRIKNGHHFVGACLVCFDAVIGDHAFDAATKALSNIYRFEGAVAIEWQESPVNRIERRFLSHMTCLALETLPRLLNSPCPIDHTLLLEQVLQESQLYCNSGPLRQEMWADALCWSFKHLPMPLWSHISGVQQLYALPRTALARKATQKIEALQPQTQFEPKFLPSALDAFFSAPDKKGSAALINRLHQIMGRTKGLIESEQRKLWIKKIATQIESASDSDSMSCLILAWALHVIENGTPRKDSAAVSTMQRYIRAAAKLLWESFPSKDDKLPQDMTSSDLSESYKKILNTVRSGERHVVKAALNSWHHFLIEEFDAPRLSTNIFAGEDDLAVDAQIIWPHERVRAASLLQQHSADDRFGQACSVFFAIACHGAFRQDEIARLRLANVVVGGAWVDIEIIASVLHGRLKTTASQRRVRITDEQACEVIRQWRQQRLNEIPQHKESESPGLDERLRLSNLLFGKDSSEPTKIERRNEMLRLINRALKLATGNPNASLHWLRHTFISEASVLVFNSTNLMSRNRFWEIGNSAGHSSAITTLTSYSHMYEASLRIQLNCALNKSITWSSACAARILGIPASTLRKKKQRCNQNVESLESIVHDALHRHAQLIPIPSVDHSLDLKNYETVTLNWATPKFSIETLMSILEELGQKDSAQSHFSISLKYQIDIGKIQGIQEAAIFVCSKIIEKNTFSVYFEDGRNSRNNNLKRLKSLDYLLLILRIDLKRRNQEKYNSLKKYLIEDIFLDDRKIKKLMQAWLTAYRGGYISLENNEASEKIIDFLSEAKIPYEFLQVKTSMINGCKYLMKKWFDGFSVNLKPNIVPTRSDRPKTYLVWTKKAHRNAPVSSAAGEVLGLSAWMFGLSVWVTFLSKEVKNDLFLGQEVYSEK